MISRSIPTIALLTCLAFAAGCGKSNEAQAPAAPNAPAIAADTIFTGGDIVTVTAAHPTVEALAVKDGRILAVGARSDLEKTFKGPATVTVDLGGKTLLPGFIDPHSHFIDALTMADRANVSAPPVGPAGNPAEIVAALQKFAKDKAIKPGELVMGYGYDENLMPKANELTRDILDQAFPDNPVTVIHVSLHGAVLNSAAFAKFGYKDGMPTPPGGVILRKPGTQKLAGLVMETAFLQVFANMPSPTPDTELAAAKAGQLIYAAAGVTTAQEGATHAAQLAQLQRVAAQGGLYIDVVSYPFITDLDRVLASNPPSTFGKYKQHLKIGGCKITGDGSPQGKTAWFTTPYLTGGPAGEKNWKGEPGLPVKMMQDGVRKCYDNGLQLLFHGNGDGAIDFLLKTHEMAAPDGLAKDRRTVLIHGQFVRLDQLAKLKQYNIVPSFFTEHTFFFADAHVKNRGKEQAFFVSPLKSAIAAGLRPTNHTDYSVAPIDQMMTMWTAVNRVSRTGEVIGPDERVTPLEALQAITANAAYQYGEEGTKGTLEAGKVADLVILDRNPLKVDPMAIKEIKVVETFKEGKSIYKAR